MMTDRQVMIEITTNCNFDCDYCYRKHYESKMMSFDDVKRIVDEWKDHSTKITFVLAGEGETMTHPRFWDIVEYIRGTKHHLTMITNGSAINEHNARQMRGKFDRVAVSLDTMDPVLAEQVGRHFHDKVIAGIRLLSQLQIPLMIMTTDFGQDIDPVREFINTLPTRVVEHRVQALYTKHDYATSYTMFSPTIPLIPESPRRVMCPLASSGTFVAYDVNGIKTPCCYIKDKSTYTGYEQLVSILSDPSNTTIPTTCRGCRLLSIAL